MFSGQIQCMFLETAWGIKCQLAGQNTGKQHFSLNSSVLIWEERWSGAWSAILQHQSAELSLPWQVPCVPLQNMQCFCASALKLFLTLNTFPFCPPHYLCFQRSSSEQEALLCVHVWWVHAGQQPATHPSCSPTPPPQGQKAGGRKWDGKSS